MFTNIWAAKTLVYSPFSYIKDSVLYNLYLEDFRYAKESGLDLRIKTANQESSRAYFDKAILRMLNRGDISDENGLLKLSLTDEPGSTRKVNGKYFANISYNRF